MEDTKTRQDRRTGRSLDSSRLRESLATLPLRPPVRVLTGSTLADAIRRMRDGNAGACLVEDKNGVLAGIFTERDLLRQVRLERGGLEELLVDQLMHSNPETLTLKHPIAYALNRMAGGGYRNVPLVDGDGKAVGLVTLRDIVEDLIEHFGEDVLSLPPTRRSAIAREREGA